MEIKAAQAAIEAILFASGEAVPAERLADALEIDRGTVRRLASSLADRVNSSGGGLEIIHTEDSYQLVTRSEYASLIRRALDIRRNMPLSQASMEALAIVAYSQPVTRGYIEEIRGVDCSGIISTLLGKGLIEEHGRLDVPGRPILYGTTQNFLRCFGLGSLSDLPQVRDEPVDEKRTNTAPQGAGTGGQAGGQTGAKAEERGEDGE
jgi:segregation and condensation protein B